MCLAIYQPAGKSIPESYLRTGFEGNPDGAGFMYFDDKGKLQVEKFMQFDQFIERYESCWLMHGEKSPFAIHFRWATHGSKNLLNVHPFMVNENVSVMHNGIIDCHIDDHEMSDTASFVKNYLGALPEHWYDNEYLFDMVQQYTQGSKLIVFTDTPGSEYCAYILNEDAGHWNNGVWYSNASYEKKKYVAPFFTIKSAKQSAIAFENEDLLSNPCTSCGVEMPTTGECLSCERCELCDSVDLLENLCYGCGTCQVCFLTEEDCMCYHPMGIHTMTDSQFMKRM
jgi:glutamine amidotransferase